MAELLFTDAFMDDMLQIYSKKVYEAVFRAIELLPSVPVLGSTDLPDSILTKYGPMVRKMVVPPFLVVYKILDDGDFLILGLLHERSAS